MSAVANLASVKMTLLTAAGNGVIFRISQPEAHDLRAWLSAFRIENQGQRRWITQKAKEVDYGVNVHFELPAHVDVNEVRDFMHILVAIDGGDVSQAKVYTQSQAKHFLAYVVALNDEAQFLLQLQRDTLEHERMVSDG